MDRTQPHRLTMHVSPEDGGFVVQCVENGVATEGDTYADALLNFAEAMALYYESAD